MPAIYHKGSVNKVVEEGEYADDITLSHNDGV